DSNAVAVIFPGITSYMNQILAIRQESALRTIKTVKGEPLGKPAGDADLVDLRLAGTIRREQHVAAVRRPAGFGLGTRMVRQPSQLVGTQIHHIDIGAAIDRKSTRLNSSHVKISYAVFC